MKTIHSTVVLLALVALTGCNGFVKKICTQKESCIKDKKCQCWCSVKCGYRDKDATDHPIYITSDPNGKFCYCKQWDADNYKANCIEGKNIKEPPGAQ